MHYYRWQSLIKNENELHFTGIGGGIFQCDNTKDAQIRAKKESGNRFKEGEWVQIMDLDKWNVYVGNAKLMLDIIPEKYAKALLQKHGYEDDYFVNYDDCEK